MGVKIMLFGKERLKLLELVLREKRWETKKWIGHKTIAERHSSEQLCNGASAPDYILKLFHRSGGREMIFIYL